DSRVRAPKIQDPPYEVELDPAVVPLLNEFANKARQILLAAFFDFVKHSGAMIEIDGPPVIGINETKIPQITSLVKIRHPRTGHLHQDLSQTIQHAVFGDPSLEFQEIIQKQIAAAGFQDGPKKTR